MNRTIEQFIKKITKEISDENVAIFSGAGFSLSAGFVNWEELITPLAYELGLDIKKETDFVSLDQYYFNYKGQNRHDISHLILEAFCKQVKPTENHKILSRLPIKTYWTTNYDSLIEDALKEEGKIPDIKYTVEQLGSTTPKRDAIVYKMHGDKEHSSNAILIKDDYETYHIEYAPYITALSGDLISKTFIFVGFSFTDPNLDYVFSRIRATYKTNSRTHYHFIKELKKEEFDLKDDFEHFKRKQELFIADLQRYNIQPLLIKEYSEITEIFKTIEKRINRKNIFISGSAAKYTPLEKDGEKFISELSKKIISKDYNIITGFGLGVGSLVISGALEEIYMNQKRIDNRRLLMRPFPQIVHTGDIQKIWEKYRKDMISRAGISIFIFGNKKNNDVIVEANGMYREFEIAREMKNKIVPVGATHWMARKIWEEINQNYSDFYDEENKNLKSLFNELNNDELTIEELEGVILEFINEIEGDR